MKCSTEPAIVCLSHLPWDFVWQRPQQILSRLAREYPLLYINEPHPSAVPTPQATPCPAGEGISAWQLLIPDRDEALSAWRRHYWRLVRSLLLQAGWVQEAGDRLVARRPLILWFYTPMPHYMADLVPSSLIVYDVMDELANFNGAAKELPEREKQLLAQADLVFAGGRSLYQARRGQHPNLHLFPSGVEPDHFRAAFAPETPLSPQLAAAPPPRLGYIGVIDERLDLALLERLAQEHSDCSLVLVGPVRKIEPESLPQRPNIHYLGLQPYNALPQLLKGFAVCLMPFALNEATKRISPTKALEYMAAHKPIVSTPVPDVVASWNDVVWIARKPDCFAQAVQEALDETEAARLERRQREQEYLEANTWDTVTRKMQRLIAQALHDTSRNLAEG